MSTIGGPGGIGGPKGPNGPDGPQAGASEIADARVEDRAHPSDGAGIAGTAGLRGVAGDAAIEQAHGSAGVGDVQALSAEVAAGRLTPREAIDRLVDAAAGPGLEAADRAELRELLTDLVANDPYLGGLAGRI